MSDTPLQRVQAGDPLKFPAATFNIFCDTAEAVARMRTQNAAGVPQGRDLNTGVVTVRNDSGYDRERFDVLGIDTPIIDNSDNLAEFKNRVTFKGETPSLASHVGRFAILLEPIAAGKLGKAVVSGVTVARIDVANTYHGFAEIIGGDCGKLRSGPCGGAQILWKETGTGLLWGIVRVGTPTLTCRFELKQNLVPGGYAQAYLLDYAGVYQIDPAVEITVYDTLSIRRGRARNYPYYSGSAGYARYWHDSGRWEIIEMHPMAMILQGQVDQSSGVEPGDSTFAVDGVTLMQPIGGLLDAMPATVRNRFSQKLKDDDRVLILWNETDTAWDAFSPGTKASGIQWAKVYGTFTNASGATSHTVTCQKCAVGRHRCGRPTRSARRRCGPTWTPRCSTATSSATRRSPTTAR